MPVLRVHYFYGFNRSDVAHDAVPEREAHSLGADGEPSGVLCREVCREVALNLIEDLRRHPQLVHSEIETGEQEVARQNWDQNVGVDNDDLR